MDSIGKQARKTLEILNLTLIVSYTFELGEVRELTDSHIKSLREKFGPEASIRFETLEEAFFDPTFIKGRVLRLNIGKKKIKLDDFKICVTKEVRLFPLGIGVVRYIFPFTGTKLTVEKIVDLLAKLFLELKIREFALRDGAEIRKSIGIENTQFMIYAYRIYIISETNLDSEKQLYMLTEKKPEEIDEARVYAAQEFMNYAPEIAGLIACSAFWKRYREDVVAKRSLNLGYLVDEVYVVDDDATLIYQPRLEINSRFNPRHYVEGIILAIEYLRALRHAFSYFDLMVDGISRRTTQDLLDSWKIVQTSKISKELDDVRHRLGQTIFDLDIFKAQVIVILDIYRNINIAGREHSATFLDHAINKFQLDRLYASLTDKLSTLERLYETVHSLISHELTIRTQHEIITLQETEHKTEEKQTTLLESIDELMQTSERTNLALNILNIIVSATMAFQVGNIVAPLLGVNEGQPWIWASLHFSLFFLFASIFVCFTRVIDKMRASSLLIQTEFDENDGFYDAQAFNLLLKQCFFLKRKREGNEMKDTFKKKTIIKRIFGWLGLESQVVTLTYDIEKSKLLKLIIKVESPKCLNEDYVDRLIKDQAKELTEHGVIINLEKLVQTKTYEGKKKGRI